MGPDDVIGWITCRGLVVLLKEIRNTKSWV